jgi:hypothetical protein
MDRICQGLVTDPVNVDVVDTAPQQYATEFQLMYSMEFVDLLAMGVTTGSSIILSASKFD